MYELVFEMVRSIIFVDKTYVYGLPPVLFGLNERENTLNRLSFWPLRVCLCASE